ELAGRTRGTEAGPRDAVPRRAARGGSPRSGVRPPPRRAVTRTFAVRSRFSAPILRLGAAAALVRAARARAGGPRRIDAPRRVRRPRVVLANGLFDLPHVGHLRYLRGARRLGDLLIVAVNDDASARRLRGPGRPLVAAADRARLVAAFRGVDAVVLFGGVTAEWVLRRLRPDVHCKGTDYAPS